MTLFSDAPARLVGGALLAAALMTVFSAVLAWHGLRRVFDIPRVPRPRALYWALAVLWCVTATACAATVTVALLFRDHQRVDGRTQIGELRCQAIRPGHVRVELRTAAAVGPERYDVDGDACIVSIKEVELRPGLRALGVPALARVDGVGPLLRPTANPHWLTPEAATRTRLIDLIVRSTRAVPIVVPADPKQRFVLVATPGRELALERPST